MNYETLQSQHHTLHIKEMCLSDVNGLKGFYCDGSIAIEKDMTSIEKACVLAEELGHHYTTVGNILDQEDASNRKQERRARLWSYRKMFDLADLLSAYKYGCRNRYEVAEYLEITEDFLEEAINAYKEIYGICTKVDRYVIYFDPLSILELHN